jgi:non-ribosomal peptide synthetase component E (peptide arylation enzyme)
MRQDVSGWQTRLSDALMAENTRSGIWRNKTLADLLADQIARDPDQILIVDGDTQMSAHDIDIQAHALAGALQKRGLVPGDVISFQLPNWREAVVVDVAASLLGLVCNPIIPIYRDAEVAYILKDAGTKFVFVPTEPNSSSCPPNFAVSTMWR